MWTLNLLERMISDSSLFVLLLSLYEKTAVLHIFSWREKWCVNSLQFKLNLTSWFNKIHLWETQIQIIKKFKIFGTINFVTVFRRTWTDTEELLKEKSFFHTFFCVLVWTCNQTSSNQHLLVGWNFVYFAFVFRKKLFTFFPPLVGGVTKFSGHLVPS